MGAGDAENESAAALAIGAPEGIDARALRVDRSVGSLRRHAARGTLINSAFDVCLTGISTFQRLAVAAWLTRADYGFWGILIGALVAIAWLKNTGIGDKYIQQSEPDQERAFQKAFTLELTISVGFYAVAALALPLYALAYGRPQIIVPGLVLALAVPITAFEAPTWIPYRRLQYGRQRLLMAIDPVVTFVVAIGLAAAGFGYWGLIAGALTGSAVAGIVCVVTCPYPLRLVFERGTLREYASFSWPLVGFGVCSFVLIQGLMLVANRTVGLAGIGAIGLAGNLAGLADQVDGIVSQTLYPAVCATADRLEVLAEVFVKSNRLAVMWALPATAGIALFAGDLIHFLLGDRWSSAAGLFAAVALTAGFGQIAFNWSVFLRAVNNTKPIFKAALLDVTVFFVVSVPAIITLGLTGYAIGFACMTAAQVVLRGYYMRRLFGSYSVIRQLVRAVLPTIPPVAVVLLLRAATGGHRSAAQVVGEMALYVAGAIACTLWLERPLVMELLGYLRKRRPAAAQPA